MVQAFAKDLLPPFPYRAFTSVFRLHKWRCKDFAIFLLPRTQLVNLNANVNMHCERERELMLWKEKERIKKPRKKPLP